MSQNRYVTTEPSCRSAPIVGAVAIVASAGGIPALITLLASLPGKFPLPIFVAQHLARGPSALDRILSWHCALGVSWAVQGAQPQEGHVHLVPPGMRLSVTNGGFELSPLAAPASSWLASGDYLISSVAALYGSRSIGIALSGLMPAGVEGLRAIKTSGGFAIAQDSISSRCLEMPSAAIDFAKTEIVLPPERIASVLEIIAREWQDETAQMAQQRAECGNGYQTERLAAIQQGIG